jgi:hypothetical protein
MEFTDKLTELVERASVIVEPPTRCAGTASRSAGRARAGGRSRFASCAAHGAAPARRRRRCGSPCAAATRVDHERDTRLAIPEDRRLVLLRRPVSDGRRKDHRLQRYGPRDLPYTLKLAAPFRSAFRHCILDVCPR